jgi:hypothetical protein
LLKANLDASLYEYLVCLRADSTGKKEEKIATIHGG